MDYLEVRDKVVEIVDNRLGCSRDEITDNSSLIEDLGADELDMVEILIDLEDEFDIMLSIEDFDPHEDHTIKETTLLILGG